MNESSLQRNETINIKIHERNIPSRELPPLLSFYPKSTKYIQQPVVDVTTRTSLKDYDIYNVTQVFNPGNTKSPWNGYVNAINIESELKNQIYPMSRTSEHVYVPSSSSDLYSYPAYPQDPFKSATLDSPALFNETNRGNIFHNCTRNQLKDKYNGY
jgi:hypothetical protein